MGHLSGRIIEEDLFTKYSIIDSALPEGQKIHAFLAARAQALAGKYIDFEKTPVTFVLSDSDTPNAFFAPAPNPDPDKRPRRDDYKSTRTIKNPLKTPVICVTRGLIEMVENIDQLDFILGHELTHMIMRMHNIEHNSKGEEEMADLHAVDLMYDAGSDPKQALIMTDKLSAYHEEEKKKQDEKTKRRGGRWVNLDDDEEKGIRWSDIFDVHMTGNNRKSGIEASLTRLSHLIDERKPSPINKAALDYHYNDPIDSFLKDNGYEGKKPLGKLKVLIDCIDHLSYTISAEQYFTEQIEKLEHEHDERYYDSHLIHRYEQLTKHRDEGYTHYFSGAVIDKRYQQKLANLAEAVLEKVKDERKDKSNPQKPAIINGEDLNVYLQNKAYAHIDQNGYPTAGDVNYKDAAGILYSYFYYLLDHHSPERNEEPDIDEDEQTQTAEIYKPRVFPNIQNDMNAARAQIASAKNAAEFTTAADTLTRLEDFYAEIKTTGYGAEGRGDKLDNLSGFKGHLFRYSHNKDRMFGKMKPSKTVPWNNLVQIAKSEPQTAEQITTFLYRHNVEDFRITHDVPYIRTDFHSCFKIEDDTRTAARKVPAYELDFAVHNDLILQAYDYIQDYFDDEDNLVAQTCDAALNLEDKDFQEFDSLTEQYNRNSLASNKVYDFISLYNSLPNIDEERSSYLDEPSIIALIPHRYRKNSPVPGSREVSGFRGNNIRYDYTTDLFQFKNPIFQKHFGANFEEEIVEKKQNQQEKMFETTLQLLENTVDIWIEAKPKKDALSKTLSDVRSAIWDSEDEAFIAEKTKEKEKLETEYNFYNEKEDTTGSLIYNILASIYDRDHTQWQLQRLTPEQKIKLAEFAIKDEKGAIRQIFHASGYEQFCDYLKILEQQTDAVLAGEYTLIPMMQIIAANHGYVSAQTPEELSAFVNEHKESKYSREDQKYSWYLHVFDTMRHLEKTSRINVNHLAIAVARIEQSERSSNGADNHEIVSQRYQNYQKFIKNSNIVPLLAKAVNNQDNYEGLSCTELLETADNLIEIRGNLAKVFSGKSDYSYSGKQKSQTTAEQQKFLRLLDKNIRGLIRKAEHQALQNDNPLQKISDLFATYHPYNEYYSSDSNRNGYLGKIKKKEKRLEHISDLSKENGFWPTDVLEHIKAYVFAKNTFLDDREYEDKIINTLLDKLETLPAGKKKNECLFILLDENLRAPYPQTRDRLFDIYTADVAEKLGEDDATQKYQNRLAVYLKALERTTDDHERREKRKDWDTGNRHGFQEGLLANNMAAADKYLLMRKLSDAIISQEQTSQVIKESCQIKLNSNDMVQSYLYGIGVDYLTEEMDRDADMAHKFITFLNSKGEQKDCEQISKYLQESYKKKYSNWPERLQEVLKNITPSHCKILYENFWSAPLEARAVVIARMLNSAVDDNDENSNKVDAAQSWQDVFDLVMDILISPDDQSTEALYARDIMHSYIKSRSDYERVLIMSAMMVANRNIGDDAGNIGKALKLFMENMGPAEIKLGQAIASHPDTPESIRVELQELKNAADKPARWTLYEWIRNEKIPEEFWKNKYIGKILGSASYYTTAALGDDQVLRLLRPEAREKATKGFRVIHATVNDLKIKEQNSELDYDELTTSVQEMIIQAAKMSGIETNHDIGEQQYKDATNIYNGVTLKADGYSFPLKVMDWRARGNNWIIMDRAKGPTFNDLPSKTPEQRAFKKAFAKAYIAFEMKNILSGKKFDHDKHGAQLSIDEQTGETGIYDTGAMAIHDPSTEDQRILGNILHVSIKRSLSGEEIHTAFSAVISAKIAELHADDKDTQYLVEVKKGMLALGDFFKVLNAEEIKEILPAIDLAHDLSADVQNGITEDMSLFDKAQYKGFLAIQSNKQSPNVLTIKDENKSGLPLDHTVLTFDIASHVPDKSSWLHEAFSNPDTSNDNNENIITEQNTEQFHVRTPRHRVDELSFS